MNLQKRDILSKMVSGRASAKEIGEALSMSPTSVSREIMRNRSESADPLPGSLCSGCANAGTCKIKHVCGRKECSLRCSGCKSISRCPRFEKFSCDVEKRWPLCCDGCPKEGGCPLKKYYYDPEAAEKKARDRLVEARSGADMTEEEKGAMDDALYDAVILKKQSVHQAMAGNKDAIKCSEKTVYRRISSGIFKVRNIDLPRQPGLKKRKHKKMADKYAYVHGDVDRKGHLYSDWLAYRPTHGVINYFEMDFLGKPHASSKEVLVLTLAGYSFSLLYLVEDATQEKVGQVFDSIEAAIGLDGFKKLFPAIVTDRDVKFDDFSKIEFDGNGEKRTSVFFCSPAASNEKPYVENFNGQLRSPIPKDAILNDATQEQLLSVASNMDSRSLFSIDDRTPYDLFVMIFGKDIADKLGIKKVPAKEVCLRLVWKRG